MAELRAEGRTENASLHTDSSGNDGFGNGDSPENCTMNGDIQGRRQRPVSAMGVVDLFSADAEEKEDCLPSVSFHSLNPVEA